MNRRYFGAALAFVCVFGSLAGCEMFNHNVRQKDRDDAVAHASGESAETEPEGDKILDVRSDSKKAKPFFRSSRLSGGLSSEAKEIENDLGIR